MNTIILTGGTNKRFGSDKSKSLIRDKTLLQVLVSNLSSDRLIIVGPKAEVDAEYVQEDPPMSGPVAAIGCAMDLVTSDLVGIFATDMPFAPLLIPYLIADFKDDATLPVDTEGNLQPLAGVYRSKSLKYALNQASPLANQSVRNLLRHLKINQVSVPDPDYLIDIDTPADLIRAIDVQGKLMQ